MAQYASCFSNFGPPRAPLVAIRLQLLHHLADGARRPRLECESASPAGPTTRPPMTLLPTRSPEKSAIRGKAMPDPSGVPRQAALLLTPVLMVLATPSGVFSRLSPFVVLRN